MLDFVKTHPTTQRGNRAKCNSIVERILTYQYLTLLSDFRKKEM